MSANSFTWEGLGDFRAMLRNLPRALHGDARNIVHARANRAALAIRSKYPQVTGNLVEHVIVDIHDTDRIAAAVVRSTAHHAWLYEKGTKVRKHKDGANKGRSPKHPIFVKEAMRERAAMRRDLRDMMRRHHIRVTGTGWI